MTFFFANFKNSSRFRNCFLGTWFFMQFKIFHWLDIRLRQTNFWELWKYLFWENVFFHPRRDSGIALMKMFVHIKSVSNEVVKNFVGVWMNLEFEGIYNPISFDRKQIQTVIFFGTENCIFWKTAVEVGIFFQFLNESIQLRSEIFAFKNC